MLAGTALPLGFSLTQCLWWLSQALGTFPPALTRCAWLCVISFTRNLAGGQLSVPLDGLGSQISGHSGLLLLVGGQWRGQRASVGGLGNKRQRVQKSTAS